MGLMQKELKALGLLAYRLPWRLSAQSLCTACLCRRHTYRGVGKKRKGGEHFGSNLACWGQGYVVLT